MTDRLLRGRHVVVDPKALPDDGLLDDGAVFVSGGVVVESGPWPALRARHPDVEVLGSDAHMVLPGFVNAHHHGRGLSAAQLGTPDDVLECWMLDFMAMPPLDTRLDTMWSALNMLRSGVTTVIHSAYAREAGQGEAETAAALDAYRETGMRVAYAVGFEDAVKLVGKGDTEFVASLPPDLAETARSLIEPPPPGAADDYFAFVDALAESHADDDRVRILYGPSWHLWCSGALLARTAEEARRTGLGIHTHVLESPMEEDYAAAVYGVDTVSRLDRLGLLAPGTSFAHGTWLSAEDMARCATAGVVVCHNPGSNLRLRNGIAPVAEMLAAGVTVGLGMDSWGFESDDDILTEMRLATHLMRRGGPDRFGPAPDYADALRMLTVNGARASTFGDGLGRFLPGSPADAVLIDLAAMASPYLDADPVASFVLLARREHIETVLVGGEIAMHRGRFPGIDRDAVGEALAAVATRPAGETQVRFRQGLRALRPHVARYFGRAG
ncbi:MAG: amidohydrolase family protein [Rhodospirillaceae bacterium]|nr:amidohydrolase family protein [Rhodospirillaceae bacterium]